MDDIKARLQSFLRVHFVNYQLADDEDIFSTGHVTSMFAIQLVAFIEGEFGIQIESEDLDLDNFRTLSAMRALILKKKS